MWPQCVLGVVNSISLHSIDYYRPLAHKLTQLGNISADVILRMNVMILFLLIVIAFLHALIAPMASIYNATSTVHR